MKISERKGKFLFISILFLMLLFGIGSVSAAELDVGPSGYTYTTVNQALAVAQPGDTINVHDNNGSSYTYHENIAINKANISLVSKGNVTLTPSNNKTGLVISNLGNGSSITGFNIIAEAWTDDGTGVYPIGVDLYGSHNCVLNNQIKGFFFGIAAGKNNVVSNNFIWNCSYGIETGGSNLTNNTIHNCTMGISDHGSEQLNVIYRNHIYDCEEGIYLIMTYMSYIAENNIHNCLVACISYSANLTFDNNTIQNCNQGIFVNANQNIVCRNTILNNKVGISLVDAYDTQISGNTVRFSDTGIKLEGCSRNNITQNNITNNTVGILIDEYVDSTATILSSNNTIYGNDISYNGDGIVFGSIFSTPYGNTVHYNRIVGNTAWGLVNYSDEVVDARWNWWGSNADPKNKIYGTTSGGVITNVNYNPWIVLTGYAWSTNITAGESADISAYLNTLSNGWPVIGGYVPNGMKVLFSTTRGSIASPKYTLLGQTGSKLTTTLSTLSGTAIISITVDNETITLPVTIKGITTASIINTTNYIKNYFRKYHKLPANVTLAGQTISITQFIKFMGTAVWEINGPKLPFGTYRGKISKREYLNMATIVNNFINSNGRAPNYYRTSQGTISTYSIISLYSAIFGFYNTYNRLPNYVRL